MSPTDHRLPQIVVPSTTTSCHDIAFQEGTSCTASVHHEQDIILHYEISGYSIQGEGNIYKRLQNGKPLNNSPGARIVCDTPLLCFLDPKSLYEAACVCKLWWAELWTPCKLKYFFGLSPPPSLRPRSSPKNSISLVSCTSEDLLSSDSNTPKGQERKESLGSRSTSSWLHSFTSSVDRKMTTNPTETSVSLHFNEDEVILGSLKKNFPKLTVTPQTRRTLWKFILLGEYSDLDWMLYNKIESEFEQTINQFIKSHNNQSELHDQKIDSATVHSSPTIYCLKKNFPKRLSDMTDTIENSKLNTLDGFAKKNQFFNHYDDLIYRDIDRTFPQRLLFSRYQSEEWTPSQKSLFRLLQYISIKRSSDLGYCQGMNFVAATLLDVFNGDEIEALQCFSAFLKISDFGKVFEPSLQSVQSACHLLDQLIQLYIPNLGNHFLKIHLNSMTFALKWIVTFLTYDLPFDSVCIVWDQLLIIESSTVILQVILGILSVHQKRLLEMDFENCLKYLKDIMAHSHITIQILAEFVDRFPVTSSPYKVLEKRAMTTPLEDERNMSVPKKCPSDQKLTNRSLPKIIYGSVFSICQRQNELQMNHMKSQREAIQSGRCQTPNSLCDESQLSTQGLTAEISDEVQIESADPIIDFSKQQLHTILGSNFSVSSWKMRRRCECSKDHMLHKS